MNTVDLIDRDVLKADIITTGVITFDNPALSYIASADRVTTHSKSIEEIIDEYKESIKLRPMTCINCGGSICRDSMTCEFCGTQYKL